MNTIVFLASGNGGTLKFVNEAIKLYNFPLKVIGVVADRDCGAYEYAVEQNIDAKILDFRIDGQRNVASYLEEKTPDFIVTNVHKILNNNVLSIKKSKFVNLHYSLLPAYSGLIGMKTVDSAFEDDVKFIGATCHVVNEEVDAGKVLGQCITPTNWTEKTASDYYDGVFRVGSLILLNQLLNNTTANTTSVRQYKEFLINPPLHFQIDLLVESFWESIK